MKETMGKPATRRSTALPRDGAQDRHYLTGAGNPSNGHESDDLVDLLGVYIDHEDSDDEDNDGIASSSAFCGPHQVFVVKALSKVISGFRPSMTCEGFLARVSTTPTGCSLSPIGRDQQLIFKYEPPSASFSSKLPGCTSYRLQLLHGSQFLYSLRGLPKEIRYQRAAHALEWGPVHMVFAAASDLNTFLSTLKYVDVAEVGPGASGKLVQQPPQQALRQCDGIRRCVVSETASGSVGCAHRSQPQSHVEGNAAAGNTSGSRAVYHPSHNIQATRSALTAKAPATHATVAATRAVTHCAKESAGMPSAGRRIPERVRG